jgi:hypothetical protein
MPAVFRPVTTCGVLASCTKLPRDQVKELADAVNALAEPRPGLVAVSAS